MSNEQKQFSLLCEQGDLGLWDTPVSQEDNKKLNEQMVQREEPKKEKKN